MAKVDTSFNFGRNAPKPKTRKPRKTGSGGGRSNGAWAAYAKGSKR